MSFTACLSPSLGSITVFSCFSYSGRVPLPSYVFYDIRFLKTVLLIKNLHVIKNQFKHAVSMIFSKFTELSRHLYNPILLHFSYHHRSPMSTCSGSLLPTPAQETTDLLFVITHVPFLDIPYSPTVESLHIWLLLLNVTFLKVIHIVVCICVFLFIV